MSVKRFYKVVTVGSHHDLHTILLDNKSALTPSRRLLAVQSRALAEQIAAEWAAQSETLDPRTMPMTRLTYAAIDSVDQTADAVRADLVKYAGSDLVCYRAESPQALVKLQEEAWDSILFWARDKLGAHFVVVEGVNFTPQPQLALDIIACHVNQFTPLGLTALHSMTTLMGSVLLALAVADKALLPLDAWQAAHVDEDWTNSQWGADAEAEARRAARWVEMNAAANFLFHALEKS